VDAQRGDEGKRRQALDYLCGNYWHPVYAYARRRGITAEDAEDLTQSFFAQFFCEQFERIDFDKRLGKLRSYLLTSFKNFIRNEHRHQSALKRGGGQRPLSLEGELAEAWYGDEPHDDETPETLFERRWALRVMEAAFEKLEQTYAADGKSEVYRALKNALAMPSRTISFAEIGRPLGMSGGTARVAAYRMRQKLKDLIRKEIGYTVGSEDDVEDELRHLRATLAK